MKEKPILFSGPMVRAILEGRKTQTRRIVKPQPTEQLYQISNTTDFAPTDPLAPNAPDFARVIHCPYGQPGDRLWVRETWASDDNKTAWYRADGETYNAGLPWRPSIFMPRWASRITLENINMRVERVQEITEEDAKAEGVDQEFRTVVMSPSGCKDYHIPNSYRGGFANLWDAINSKRGYSWGANPWVWVVEFKPC